MERRQCRRHTVASFCMAVAGSREEKQSSSATATDAEAKSKENEDEEEEETEMPIPRRQRRRHTVTGLSMRATSSAKEARLVRHNNADDDDDDSDGSPKSAKSGRSEAPMTQAASFPGCRGRGRSSPRWSDMGSDGEDDIWQSFRVTAGSLTFKPKEQDSIEKVPSDASSTCDSPTEMPFGAAMSWSPGAVQRKGKRNNLMLPVPKRCIQQQDEAPPTPGVLVQQQFNRNMLLSWSS